MGPNFNQIRTNRDLPDTSRSLLTNDRIEKLEEIRHKTWAALEPAFQINQLERFTRAFIEEHYSKGPAYQTLLKKMDYIFKAENPIERDFQVPHRIQISQNASPCIFTMFPGAGTHESLSQYDIVASPRYSTVHSRSEVSLNTTLTRSSQTEMSLPILVANMPASIGEELADIIVDQGMIPIFHRFRRPLDKDNCDTSNPTVQTQSEADLEKIHLAQRFGSRAFFSCGVNPSSINFAKTLIELGAGGVCVDIALGNSEMAVSAVIELREFIDSNGHNAQIIAGNVDSAEGYFMLAYAGADCVKVGIGPGSPCTTRSVTGAGSGQASALMAVARAKFVYGEGAPTFIADGGIERPSNALMALILQASSVMMGKLAAKCEESGALKREIDGKKYAWYYGCASKWARIYEAGGVKSGMTVEGEGNWIPVSGRFEELCNSFKAGLTNAFPYYNARTIPELQQKFSIPQQLCDLILGDTTGIYKSSSGTSTESGTRLF